METTNTATAPEAPVSDSQVYIPFGIYKLLCLECKRGNSSKGNPQLVETWEIIDNAESKFNGIKILIFRSLVDKALFFVNEERQAIGLPIVKEADLATLDEKDYIGQTGYSTLNTTVKEQKNEVTGEVLVNPNTGEKMVDVRRNHVQWCKR